VSAIPNSGECNSEKGVSTIPKTSLIMVSAIPNSFFNSVLIFLVIRDF